MGNESTDTAGSDADRRHARTIDVALAFAVFAVTAAALVSALARADAPAFSWHHTLIAPLLSGLILLRRRAPLAVIVASSIALIGYYAGGGPGIGLELPLAAAMFSAGERGRAREAFAVAGAVLIVAYAYRMSTQGGFWKFFGLEAMTTAVVFTGAIAAGVAVRSHARERSLLLEQARQAARLRENEIERSMADERQALARDVHDVLGHAMVVIATQANVANEAVESRPDAAREAMGHIKAVARRSIADLKTSLQVMGGGSGENRSPAPSLALLDDLIDRVRDSGLHVALDRDVDPAQLPLVVSSTGYRVLQEALTNVLRHSDATRADVAVRLDDTALAICVRDDGGCAPDWQPGRGIRGMTDRVEAVGGTLTVQGSEAGFEVAATIPVPRSLR